MKFAVFSNGKPAEAPNLSGAYLVGTDDVPIRADLTRKKGLISCKKRAAGPAALSMLWDVKGVGTVMVETVRLMERDRPYILTVEMARGRLIRLQQKLEDWGMFELEADHPVTKRVELARQAMLLRHREREVIQLHHERNEEGENEGQDDDEEVQKTHGQELILKAVRENVGALE